MRLSPDTWWPIAGHALRRLGAARAATAVAVMSLAIGIGANSAIFGVADALILRPLPYPDPDRIAVIWQRSPGLNVTQDWLSLGQYADIADSSTSFEQVAAAIGASYNLTGTGAPERIDGARVSSSFFQIFGAHTTMGRVFGPDYDVPGQPPAVILMHGFWMRQFGGDPAVIGKTLTLNGNSVEIVGVMDRAFTLNKNVMPAVNGIERADLILPLPIPAAARNNRGGEDFNVFVRLKRGVALERAQAEMDLLATRMKQRFPANYPATGGLTLSVVPLLNQVVGDVRLVLQLLLGAAALVFLIACANVANIALSQATTRGRELAIRAAVGAGRRDLIAQLVAESLALSLLGGVVGLGLAVLGIAALKAFGPANIPRIAEVGLDVRMLAFTFVVAVIGGLVVGIAPALHAANADPNGALRDGGTGTGGTTGTGHRRLRRLLAGAEIALSLVLMVGATLLVRSYQRISAADPGFNPDNVLSLRLTLPGARYRGREPVAAFYRSLEERVGALPGVAHVGTNYQLPLSSVALAWEPIGVEGYAPPTPGDSLIIASSAYVNGDYFAAMGIPLITGRFFAEQDRDGPPVAMVDDKFAARFWPGADPLGKRVRQARDTTWRTVIGVVADTRQYEILPEPPITVFLPSIQMALGSRFVVVRAAPGGGKAEALLAPVTRIIRELDPELPVYDVATMAARVSDSLARRRLAMALLGVFALCAAALATIGVYGVVGYWVEQRTREIGIRVALGATRESVYGLIAREVGVILIPGLLAGLAGVVVLARVIQSLLFGVEAWDPSSLMMALVLLAVAAIAAAWVPARRAVRVSPIVALRAQ